MDEFNFRLDLRFILDELQLYSGGQSELSLDVILVNYFEKRVVQLDFTTVAINRKLQQLSATRQLEPVITQFNFTRALNN